MKNKIKKILSLFLAVTLAFSGCLSAFCLNYPKDVTEKSALESVKRADLFIENGFFAMKNENLNDFVFSLLCEDETLSDFLKGVYSSLEESQNSLDLLGIDISTANLARLLGGYEEVKNALEKASSWSSLDLSGVKWNVKTVNEFTCAVSAMFAPFNNVLYMLLCGGSYQRGVVRIKGENGYENGVVPLLKSIGCPIIKSSEEFYSNAKENKNAITESVTLSILSLLDRVLTSPIDALTEILPEFSQFINNGDFENSINALLRPLTLHIGDYYDFFSGTQMLAFFMFISDSSKFTLDFKQNTTVFLNDALEKSDIKLADIDLNELESTKGNKGDTFIALLRFLIDTLKLNKDKLNDISLSQLSQESALDFDIKSLVDIILSKTTDNLITSLISLFTNSHGNASDYQWESRPFEKQEVSYTENLTKENFQRVLSLIDETISEFVNEYSDYSSLQSLLKFKIYSGEVITTVVKTVYSALSGGEFSKISEFLTLPKTPKDLSEYLKENRFNYAVGTLENASSFDKIQSVYWGFESGDKEGFETALVCVLRPFIPFFDMLFANDTLEILSSVHIGGTNGYNTAVIPILEALGCSESKIVPYDSYQKAKGTDKAISLILEPIFDLVAKIIKNPVKKATEILPNIIYFIDNGSLIDCVKNLLTPIIEPFEEYGIDFEKIGFDTKKLEEIDIVGEIEKKAEGLTKDIKITKPNIKKLAFLGDIESRESKRTFEGKKTSFEYVKSNQTGVLITVLRYIFGVLGEEENKDVINNLLAGNQSDEGMFGMYASGIGDEMAKMTTDETIEWLYKLLFRERAVKETTEEYIPTVIYKETQSSSSKVLPIVIVILLLSATGFCVIKREEISESHQERKKQKMRKKALKEGK